MKPVFRHQLTSDRLREVIDYDPLTGEFRWRISRPKCAKGARAGHLDREGYWTIRIDRILHEASRLAWLYVYGEWPEPCLDHINRDGSDNRVANLRIATKQQNGVNRGAQRNSLSGIKGVTAHGPGWRAKITVNDKPHCLGTFKTKEEARAAYQAAERRFFGEFAESSAA